MDEANIQHVLRCGQCNKPFDKLSTLKRHGYYCRSRKTGVHASPARSKSCLSCVRDKARCDNKQPECSRCKAKAIECNYPVKNARKDTLQTVHTPTDSLNLLDGSDYDLALNSTALAIPGAEYANLGDLETINFDQSLWTTSNDGLVSTPWAHAKGPMIPSPFDSIPTSLSPHTARSLIQRPKLRPRVANLILHTLTSYPQMMLRPNGLPPYIHPHLIWEDIDNDNMESIRNSISLMYMLNSRVPGCRKLFWKNAKMECRRFLEEHLSMNKWQLLAAMQALSIYTILRLSEGETEYNNIDSLLIAAVTALSKQFNQTFDRLSVLNSNKRELRSNWQDWIFAESSQRICVIFQVINLLVYWEPAELCDLHETDILLAPLPARKQLWEASDEFTWNNENELGKKEHAAGIKEIAFGLAANGNLVKLVHHEGEGQKCGSTTQSTADWEDWCVGMDGLGGLVMLAASLIE